MVIKRTAWFCYAGALIIGAIDLSKDWMLVFGVPVLAFFPELNQGIDALLRTLLLGFALAGVAQLVVRPPSFRGYPMLVVVGLASVVFYGVCTGFVQGNGADNVLGDAVYIALYPGLFALLAAPSDEDLTRLRNLALIIGGIVFLKYGFSIVTDFSVDFRYPAKFSFAYLPMATIAISYLIFATDNSSRLQYFLLFCAALVGLVLADTRGFYLGLGAGILFMIACARVGIARWRVIAGLSISFLVAGGVGVVARGDVLTAFGYWWGTEQFSVGLDFRVDQFRMLMNMFAKNPVFGVGLGAYDPTWEGFELWLPRPYIVELEFVNLLAKLGVIGFFVFSIVIFALFYSCYRVARKARTAEHKALATGVGSGLLALTVASFTNSIYSSVYYHLYLIMTLVVISHIPFLETKARRGGFNSSHGRSRAPIVLNQSQHNPTA